MRDKADRDIAFVIEKETSIESGHSRDRLGEPAPAAVSPVSPKSSDEPPSEGGATTFESEAPLELSDPGITAIAEPVTDSGPVEDLAGAPHPEEAVHLLASEGASCVLMREAECLGACASDSGGAHIVSGISHDMTETELSAPTVESVEPRASSSDASLLGEPQQEGDSQYICGDASPLEAVAGLAEGPVAQGFVEVAEAPKSEPPAAIIETTAAVDALGAREEFVACNEQIAPPFESVVEPEAITLDEPAKRQTNVHSQEPEAHLPSSSTPLVAVKASWRDHAKGAAWYAACAFGGYLAFVVLLIFVYRIVNPPASNLMLYQALSGRDIDQQWVSINEISPNLVRAVIVAEDGTFCSHWGIDIAAMEQAIEKAVDGIPRGASTISMQVTKNLFLWQSKSYIRKAIELPLTLLMELLWPKRRILEVYLNVAEWAPGVFGAEAAAQFHFRKRASSLSEREAALLAASLPNPMVRDAGDPGPRTLRKAGIVQSRMRAEGGDVARCIFNAK
jgi:monofunctional biosynthetic peptidoglycan transglycosylase